MGGMGGSSAYGGRGMRGGYGTGHATSMMGGMSGMGGAGMGGLMMGGMHGGMVGGSGMGAMSGMGGGMDGGMMGNYPSAYGGQMGHQRMGSGYPAARGTLNTPFGGGTGMGDYGGMMGNQALGGSNGMAFGQQLGSMTMLQLEAGELEHAVSQLKIKAGPAGSGAMNGFFGGNSMMYGAIGADLGE